MEALETSQVGDARKVVAAMVLPVVHEGEIVVAGIQPEDQKGGEPGWKQEPEQPPDGQRPSHDDEEWRADERSGFCVMLRVTAPRQRGWAVQDPLMHDVLEQSTGHEPHESDAAGHDPGAGESMEPEGQKCQRRGQVAQHHHPVIGTAVDHPIQGAEPDSCGLSGHQFPLYTDSAAHSSHAVLGDSFLAATGRTYDVASAGQRFLMIKEGAETGQIILVQNWLEELKRLVPTN